MMWNYTHADMLVFVWDDACTIQNPEFTRAHAMNVFTCVFACMTHMFGG